ncbi:MAG: cytochrome oxidase [Deltaproteobacteria bacterium]|nr:MAG: cytochrome oxidase [Deltaproteobacteria bacterium]
MTTATAGAVAAPDKDEALPLVSYDLVRAHLYFSVGYIVLVVLAGLSFALQFVGWYPFEGIEFLAPARVRMLHTQTVAYAWIASAFMGILYYVVPKLTGQRILSEKLGYLTLFGWNGIYIAGAIGILGGQAQALEWGENPTWADPIVVVFYVLFCVNIFTPIIKARAKRFYVTIWYVVGALVWTALTYLMGNFLPQYLVPGTGGAAITSMYIHDLVGLFVTPVGIGIIYYLLPLLVKKPLYSHALSLIGFWGLAFFYPLNSSHHYLYSPIPMWAQYASVVASVGVHVVVYTVVYNMLATMGRDGFRQLVQSTSLKFVVAGIIAYLVTCIQCAIHVTLSVQEIIHFTDWVPGHAHLVLFGVFSFWIFAWIYYLWPRLTGRPLFSRALAEWHFWLSTIGLWLMWVVLGIAGLQQGYMWKAMVPFVDTMVAIKPYWFVRLLSGLLIFVGQVMFVLNLLLSLRSPSSEGARGELEAA